MKIHDSYVRPNNLIRINGLRLRLYDDLLLVMTLLFSLNISKFLIYNKKLCTSLMY